jgi:PRTRC genetic system ParB family protein
MEQPSELPSDAIQPGRNPRRYFDPAAMAKLTESVQAKGIIQAITVRPTDNGYELVAGERRLRAAREAGLASVPVVVRHYSDREALEAASAENVQREDMAPSEEARVTRDLLDLHGGDRDEVKRRLGWSESRLESRLALLHATEAVLDALDRRQITLRVAGLLSGLEASKQDATVENVIAKGVSADDLKKKIQGVTKSLDAAIFDKTECQNCPFNSCVQATLLASDLDGAKCSNAKCYDRKTQEALAAQKEQMAEEYPVVFFDVEKREDSRTVLMRRGENGVGDTQFAACQSCQYYGALVHSSADKAGRVEDGMCFNLDCNREKVAAHREALKAATEVTPSAAAQSAHAGTSAAANSKGKGGATTGAANAETGPMREAAQKAIRAQARAAVAARPHWSLATAVAALADQVHALGHGQGNPADAGVAAPVVRALAVDYAQTKVIPALAQCSEADLLDAQQRLAGMIFERSHITVNSQQEATAAARIVNESDMDPNGCLWTTHDLIQAERKAGLVTMMRESGFGDTYDAAHGDGAFKKLTKSKLAEIREAITQTDHDWSGYRPAPIASRINDPEAVLSDEIRHSIQSADHQSANGDDNANAESEPEAQGA